MDIAIQAHNQRPAAVWSPGGQDYDQIGRGIGPTKALAARLDEGGRAQLRRDFIAFHDNFATELGICVPRE